MPNKKQTSSSKQKKKKAHSYYFKCYACCTDKRNSSNFLIGYFSRQICLNIFLLFLLSPLSLFWILGIIFSSIAISYIRDINYGRKKPGSSCMILLAFWSNIVINVIATLMWFGVILGMYAASAYLMYFSAVNYDKGQASGGGIVIFFIAFMLTFIWLGFFNQVFLACRALKAEKEINNKL